MNVKYLNPFVDAAKEVIMAELQANVTRGDLSLHKSALTTDELTVLISLVGHVQGVVLYGMDIPTSLSMVSHILGQEFSEFDNLVQSGIAELANVITGRATVMLSETGVEANISPPTIIQGKEITISTLDFSRIVVPLKTDLGPITAHLALRESPPGMKDSNYVPIMADVAK